MVLQYLLKQLQTIITEQLLQLDLFLISMVVIWGPMAPWDFCLKERGFSL